MMEKQRIQEILPYLPQSIRNVLSGIVSDEWINIEEIRLRCGAPLTVGVSGESCFVTPNGGVTNYESDAYKSTEEEIRSAFAAICENSVYAHLEQISRGYITIKGGHRVGICGKAVTDGGKIKTFGEVSSLNFRIAHELIGIADGIMDYIISGTQVNSTLIIAPPQIGKTTLLRDITRQISDRGFKCGVADDRGEIAAMYRGVPTNQIGAQTDVIDGAPKAMAIEMLLRTMSPKVIISDEIATKSDMDALCLASGTGVKLIASTHGDNADEVFSRKIMKPASENKIFSQAIVLKRDFSTPDSDIEARVVPL